VTYATENTPIPLSLEPAMPALPDKPSELILLALSDLEACEKDPNYKIDMYSWHSPTYGKICLVCLAGSVMAQTLKAYSFQNLLPHDFSEEIAKKLTALNLFREGDVARGLRELNIMKKFRFRKIPEYDEYPEEFKAAMRKLARDLAAKGL
jgi:hypothetical protein